VNADRDRPTTVRDDTLSAGEVAASGVAAESQAAAPVPGGALRALIAGLVVAVALGLTLLTWALSLMFMLGLFFFMLFGLLVGAVMFRFGMRSRPMPRPRVIAITAVVSLAAWTTALGKEAVDFPRDFVDWVVEGRKFERDRVYIPPSGGVEQVRGEVRDFIDDYLAHRYPPGGAFGYLRYAASGDVIELDIHSQPRKLNIRPRVLPWVWITRGLLALPLFFLTTYSVTAGLARMPSEAELRRRYY
jgi:hypothetical protein